MPLYHCAKSLIYLDDTPGIAPEYTVLETAALSVSYTPKIWHPLPVTI
jgi:hypothetical protein